MLKALYEQLDKTRSVEERITDTYKAVNDPITSDEQLEKVITFTKPENIFGIGQVDLLQLHHSIKASRNFLPPDEYMNFV
jgi:hypothetical protein